MPTKQKTVAEELAETIEKNLNDPNNEKKEAQARAEKERRMREALLKTGALKKKGGR